VVTMTCPSLACLPAFLLTTSPLSRARGGPRPPGLKCASGTRPFHPLIHVTISENHLRVHDRAFAAGCQHCRFEFGRLPAAFVPLFKNCGALEAILVLLVPLGNSPLPPSHPPEWGSSDCEGKAGGSVSRHDQSGSNLDYKAAGSSTKIRVPAVPSKRRGAWHDDTWRCR